MSLESPMYTFETPEPVDLRVEVWTGKIDVRAEPTSQTTVELVALHGDGAAQEAISRARVEQRGNEIVVLMPKSKGSFFGRKGEVHATITAPLRSNLKVETGSADLEADGELGDVDVSSGSGDVELDQIREGSVRTGSGDVTVKRASGSVDTKCGSGDVELGQVGGDANAIAGSGDVIITAIDGRLKVKTGSGDIVVKACGDELDAMAGSGDLLVKQIARGRLKAKTGSGDISIGVANGTAAYLDIMTVTGDVRSDLDASEAPIDTENTVEIIIQSGSGDVVLQRA
ncbi:MAG: DUF4097 family beta strand repeat-containing protein [Nocardioidaceae bacterium]